MLISQETIFEWFNILRTIFFPQWIWRLVHMNNLRRLICRSSLAWKYLPSRSRIFLWGWWWTYNFLLLICSLIPMLFRKLAGHSKAYPDSQHWGGRSSVISVNSRSVCSRPQVPDPLGLHSETWSQQMGHL